MSQRPPRPLSQTSIPPPRSVPNQAMGGARNNGSSTQRLPKTEDDGNDGDGTNGGPGGDGGGANAPAQAHGGVHADGGSGSLMDGRKGAGANSSGAVSSGGAPPSIVSASPPLSAQSSVSGGAPQSGVSASPRLSAQPSQLSTGAAAAQAWDGLPGAVKACLDAAGLSHAVIQVPHTGVFADITCLFYFILFIYSFSISFYF